MLDFKVMDLKKKVIKKSNEIFLVTVNPDSTVFISLKFTP